MMTVDMLPEICTLKSASIRKISGVGPDGERGRHCELLAAGGHKWRSRRSGRGLTPFLDASPNATSEERG